MPRIRCRYDDCVFLEEGFCSAAAIEIEPDSGCLTFTRVDDAAAADEDEWEEEEFEDEFEEEEEEEWDEDDEEWDEDDDDY